MNKRNKQLLKHCPNFYKIINFDYRGLLPKDTEVRLYDTNRESY